jgi:hypothetical protein
MIVAVADRNTADVPYRFLVSSSCESSCPGDSNNLFPVPDWAVGAGAGRGKPFDKVQTRPDTSVSILDESAQPQDKQKEQNRA